MTVFTPQNKAFNTYSYIKTEWNLVNVTVTRHEVNNFVFLEYSLALKRNHAFYCKSVLCVIAIRIKIFPTEMGIKK